jgi:hypothetical protein
MFSALSITTLKAYHLHGANLDSRLAQYRDAQSTAVIGADLL